MKEKLKGIGLTDRQADAYLALCQLGVSTAATIAKKTKESRSHIYDTLLSLSHKGLVASMIRNNVQFFSAAKPEKLLELAKEKADAIASLLPSLIATMGSGIKHPRVEVYEGHEGMKTILSEIIRTKKTWYAIGSTGGSPHILHYFEIERFHKERVKSKITLKVLVHATEQAKKRAQFLMSQKYVALKYLPKTHQSPATIYVFGSKTAIVMWLASGTPFAILIEHKEIADSFRGYFAMLWKQL